jgi:hypothetical protein
VDVSLLRCGYVTSAQPSPQTGRSAPHVGPAAHRIQHGSQSGREAIEVAVVDPTVVDLMGELVEQPGPVPPGRGHGHRDLHAALDDLDR